MECLVSPCCVFVRLSCTFGPIRILRRRKGAELQPKFDEIKLNQSGSLQFLLVCRWNVCFPSLFLLLVCLFHMFTCGGMDGGMDRQTDEWSQLISGRSDQSERERGRSCYQGRLGSLVKLRLLPRPELRPPPIRKPAALTNREGIWEEKPAIIIPPRFHRSIGTQTTEI